MNTMTLSDLRNFAKQKKVDCSIACACGEYQVTLATGEVEAAVTADDVVLILREYAKS